MLLWLFLVWLFDNMEESSSFFLFVLLPIEFWFWYNIDTEWRQNICMSDWQVETYCRIVCVVLDNSPELVETLKNMSIRKINLDIFNQSWSLGEVEDWFESIKCTLSVFEMDDESKMSFSSLSLSFEWFWKNMTCTFGQHCCIWEICETIRWDEESKLDKPTKNSISDFPLLSFSINSSMMRCVLPK